MRDPAATPSDTRSPTADALALEEYRALRATIRERGTLRLIVAVITFLAWGALLLSVPLFSLSPVYVLVPLLVLAAGFESVYAAHVGVERVGRYIQARFETRGHEVPDWEHTVMRLAAQSGAGTGTDPLFIRTFAAAALLNLLPLLLSRPRGAVLVALVVGLCHAAFLRRMVRARRFAADQHKRDLELLKTAASPSAVD